MAVDKLDPYAPVPIIAPVELRKIVHRIVGYHCLCKACGVTFAAQRATAKACSTRCRQRLIRQRKRQLLRQEEEREEARVAQAEARLRQRRLGGRIANQDGLGVKPQRTPRYALRYRR